MIACHKDTLRIAELEKEVQWKQKQIVSLRERIVELEKQLICNTCAGKPISGKPCICGGTGTIHGEVQGLREACFNFRGEES